MNWNRRHFLQQLGIGGSGLVAGGSLLSLSARPAFAAPWGDFPAAAANAAVPLANRAKSILEIFLPGGICPWETFYTVVDPAFGKVDKQFWWTFQSGVNSVAAWHATCGSQLPLTEPFATDAEGVPVNLGPFVAPLRARPDVTGRMRIVVTEHDLEPHVLAVPLALTGHRAGSPKLAGMGATVERYFQTHAATPALEPHSWLIAPRLMSDTSAAAAVGKHPGSARPLSIFLSGGPAFVAALERKGIGSMQGPADALLSAYVGEFGKRLVAPGTTAPSRAAAYADHAAAADRLKEAKFIAKVLDASWFKPKPGAACGFQQALSLTTMQLGLAAWLLRRPGSQARHVTVIDQHSLLPEADGTYDSHEDHNRLSATGLHHFFTQLVANINKPGENHPNKVNLDDTMIVLNTEFGRSPGKQGVSGRNHWPYGYTTVLIGGPIGPKQKGIYGAIGPTGQAIGGVSPTATRAAVLAALGIYPFMPEGFSSAGMPGATEAAAAAWLRDQVLGLKT